MTNMVPASSSEILKRTLDTVRIRANSNGECFGGETQMRSEKLE
jgi:hypothetical protein